MNIIIREEKGDDFIFIAANILAASIDGFVSGFAIAATGAKFSCKDFLKAFRVIFLCCTLSAYTGKYLTEIYAGKYLDYFGISIIFYLSFRAFSDAGEDIQPSHSLYAVAFSVAADAAAVCIYLAISGADILSVSFFSALAHSLLMALGVKISAVVTKEKRKKATAYFSSRVFFIMAVYKLSGI